MNLTAKEIQRIIYESRKMQQRFEIMIPNCYTQPDNECDILGIKKSGYLDEIEIKISFSDFLNDSKKIVRQFDEKTRSWVVEPNGLYMPIKRAKYEALSLGLMHVNYFTYAAPEGLLSIECIPDFAGLIEIRAGENGYFIKEIKPPKRLHTNKAPLEFKYQMAKKMVYRYWSATK